MVNTRSGNGHSSAQGGTVGLTFSQTNNVGLNSQTSQVTNKQGAGDGGAGGGQKPPQKAKATRASRCAQCIDGHRRCDRVRPVCFECHKSPQALYCTYPNGDSAPNPRMQLLLAQNNPAPAAAYVAGGVANNPPAPTPATNPADADQEESDAGDEDTGDNSEESDDSEPDDSADPVDPMDVDEDDIPEDVEMDLGEDIGDEDVEMDLGEDIGEDIAHLPQPPLLMFPELAQEAPEDVAQPRSHIAPQVLHQTQPRQFSAPAFANYPTPADPTLQSFAGYPNHLGMPRPTWDPTNPRPIGPAQPGFGLHWDPQQMPVPGQNQHVPIPNMMMDRYTQDMSVARRALSAPPAAVQETVDLTGEASTSPSPQAPEPTESDANANANAQEMVDLTRDSDIE